MALSPIVIVASLAAFLYAISVALFLYKILSTPFSPGKRIGLSLLVIFVPIIGWILFFVFGGEKEVVKKMETETLVAVPKLSGEPEFYVESQGDIPRLPDDKDKTKINVRYPLLPPYAFAHIYWDAPTTELVYALEEPLLNDEETKILATLEEGIKELINLSFIKVKDQKTVFLYLEKNIKVLLTELSIKISQETYMKLMYYIYRDFVGMNELEPLMNDYFIEDVECNGVDTPIYVVHRKYRNVRTTLVYPDMNKLASFVEKLAQKCDKYVSYAEPLLDGALPDGSLDYEEPVVYRENGYVKVGKIGEIITPFYKNSKSDVPLLVNNLEVPAFDPKTLKIAWKKVNYVYRHKICDEIYELKTEFGKRVKLTGCHSIFSLTKNGLISVRTDRLTVGDYVAFPLFLPENSIVTKINLAEALAKTSYAKKIVLDAIPLRVYTLKKKEICIFYKANYKRPHQAYYEHKKKRILPLSLCALLTEEELTNTRMRTTSHGRVKPILSVDKNLMRFLGLWIAEGWLSQVGPHRRISFCLHKDEIDYMHDLEIASQHCFGLPTFLEKEKKNAVKVHIQSYVLFAVLEKVLCLVRGAKNKRVPSLVFNVSTELQREFLRAWHDGDCGSTASPLLAQDISYLALFMGDVSPFYDRERESVIEGRSTHSHEYYSNFLGRNTINPYSSMIPLEIFNPLQETNHRLTCMKINRERLREILKSTCYQRFRNIQDCHSVPFLREWTKREFICNGELTEKGKQLIQEMDVLDSLLNSDLGFARITSLEKVPSSQEYVYDFSVKDHENFVGGIGGLCCHNSRVNATYTTDVSSRGPTFTIRKFTKTPWSPIQLMQKGTVSPEMLAYLWMLIEYESSFMVVGGTGSGKTSLLNVLAFFIPPQARVVSIEDTKELQLEHENWLPSISRGGVGLTNLVGQRFGEVSLFDLLKESFRQRPDYVIVGEVRGKEAYVLFQGMASGHPSFGTMHAESVETLVRRLRTPPISLSGSLIESLMCVCVMSPVKVKGVEVRRLVKIDEVVEVPEGENSKPITSPVFSWNPQNDTFSFNPKNRLFAKASQQYGLSMEQMLQEFRVRAALLRTLYTRNIYGFKEVQKIINEYYKSPDVIVKRFGL